METEVTFVAGLRSEGLSLCPSCQLSPLPVWSRGRVYATSRGRPKKRKKQSGLAAPWRFALKALYCFAVLSS